MIVVILATLLVLGIAFYQVVQGLFSSLIMLILTVLCAAVAFGYYEVLAEAYLYSRQPATADAIALVALFVIPLLLLRLGFDKLISGNVAMHTWVDRIVGGALGLVTGTVMVGVLLVAMQLLPFGPSILGYTPYDETMERSQRVWPFYPDEFVVGLAKAVSGAALGGQRSFADVHDDLLLEAFCARNDAGKNSRTDASGGEVRVLGVYEPDDPDKLLWMDDVPANPRLGELERDRIVVVRVTVGMDAREDDRSGRSAGWWILPATHFRLACTGGEQTRSYYPLACLTWLETPLDGEPKDQHWKCVVPSTPTKGGKLQFASFTVDRPREGRWVKRGEKRQDARELVVDWVYRIARGDQPRQIVFRRVATARVKSVMTGAEANAELSSAEFAAKALDRKPARRHRRR